ncbi:MAG: ABC transporter ATP-binding protein/permease [Treponema sp.]|jgi:ATP-binding cassette subfamily B protein|nr:ABC transporter ATP-binding protein/permease [Treponema sp.]
MFNVKKLFSMTEEGYRNFRRGVFATVLSNLTLFIAFGMIIQMIMALLDPLMTGKDIDTIRVWKLFGAGLAGAALHLLAGRNEYRKTYSTAYGEAEKIRLAVAEHIRRLPLSFFNRKDLSELTTNMMDDCTSIEHVMSHVMPGMFADTITSVLITAILCFFDWRMAIALFAALPVSFGIIFITKRIQERYGRRTVEAKLEVSNQVQEYLEGIKVVKAFGLTGERWDALKDAMKTLMRRAIVFEGVAGGFISVAGIILQSGMGLVIFAGVNLLRNGALDPVRFLVFVLISAKIYGPFLVLLTLLPEFFFYLLSTERMRKLREEKLLSGEENVSLPNCNIELKNISFAYNEEEVIKNISLVIPQNGVTALVGPSGSGKSTVSRLIARFWDVKSGEISIGGRNISGIDPETLLGYMSFVFQDVVLFNDTVMNNIRIGKKDAGDEEVYAAAKTVRCDEFIRVMPEGYNTRIGENGSTLSGGERQRISIARALLKNAPIVLLDEATASLDPENEILIQEAISALVKGRTVIVIAHRLRTIIDADKIAVLDRGELVEEGSGEELLAKGGLFARLYNIQQESLGWSVARQAFP